MAMKFTPQQQRVIDLRDRNILVSAAAGSGKTAVLTERIVQMISDPEHPVDIDHLLIVTFTNAAAAEMRERISLKIAAKIEEQPYNEHLQRQATLIHNALITTIDSFCLFLIRNHFNDIGLDPGFRIADEGELKLFKKDVLDELMEELFASKSPEFLNLVEYYSAGRGEKKLEEQILSLYEAAMSYPWPEVWLDERRNDYAVTGLTEWEETPWIRFALDQIGRILKDCQANLSVLRDMCEEPDGPFMYREAVDSDRELVDGLLKTERFTGLYERFLSLRFARLSVKKDPAVSPEKREAAKRLRDLIKSTLQDIGKSYFSFSPKKDLARMQDCDRAVSELIRVVLLFREQLDAKKREKNIIDFSDMEHFALRILMEKSTEEAGVYRPSKTALDYRSYFHEILTDEYQDSNMVQEFLLSSISGEEDHTYNRFMVGDVKQSIYKFRLARPEIFLEKYDGYQEEGDTVRIDLHKNFRSRKEVIDSVNFIFRQIMIREMGGVAYDEKASLFPGAAYPEPAEGKEGCFQTEMLFIEKGDEQDITELNRKEREAWVIADRIRELAGRFEITDKETGELRPVRYRDIVILLRTGSGWDEEFKRVLEKNGIPAFVSSKTGYFSTTEIQGIMNFLRILDNPLQDIPLFGVMKSVLGGFPDEEIAVVRAVGNRAPGKQKLWDCVRLAADETQDTAPELREKCRSFLAFYGKYREKVSYLSIHHLIRRLLEETGYLYYVSVLPAGEQRRANVEMLLKKAENFGQTSYFGLFHFIRYMEQIEKYDIEYGEAGTLDENADTVRIMSIHKSKGLEFPVCFVAGLGKRFNMQDTAQALIMDMDLGLGTDYVNPETRAKCTTLRKSILAGKIRQDNLGEELRVLYVALTRAKEKLIMTGVVPDLEAAVRKYAPLSGCEETLSFSLLTGAASFLDYLIPTMLRLPSFHDFLSRQGLQIALPALPEPAAEECCILFSHVRTDDIARDTVMEALNRRERKQELLQMREQVEPQDEIFKILEQKTGYRYSHGNLRNLYAKTTVSELKRAEQAEQEDGSVMLYEEEEVIPYLPRFAGKEETAGSAVRGSAWHKVLELLPYGMEFDRETLEAYLDRSLLQGIISAEYRNAVDSGRLLTFLQTDISSRMAKAAAKHQLWREQPFVLGISADRLDPSFPPEETILVQGIIDAFFVEEGGVVIVDYKTDAVSAPEELLKRYRVQLDYYAEAVQKLAGKPVRERILYSFALGRSILV